MLLSVHFRREWHHADGRDEVYRILGVVLEEMEEKENAWFCLADRYVDDKVLAAEISMRVAINRNSGYGALIWSAGIGFAWKGSIYESIWITDNDSPPELDPKVVVDTETRRYHDPSSVVPLSDVQAAVEEFCLQGTGDRPECVKWVEGDIDGQRIDRPPMFEPDEVEFPEIDWNIFS